MTAAVVSASSGTGTNDFNVARPDGTADGDLLIAVNGSDWNTWTNNHVPPEFTNLLTSDYDGGGNNIHVQIGQLIAASEPATYTFGSGGGADTVGIILRITGHDGGPVIAEVAPVTFGSGIGATAAPSITPNGSDDLLICGVLADGANGGGTLTWTAPIGMTEQADVQSTTWTSVSLASLESPSSPSGTKAFVSSPANHNNGVAFTISIKSAGGAPSPSGTFEVADVATVGFVGQHDSSGLFPASDVTTVEWTGTRESAAGFVVDDVATVEWTGARDSTATFDVDDTATAAWAGSATATASFAVDDIVTVSWTGVGAEGVLAAIIVGAVTGPSRHVETVNGPALRRVITGPTVRRTVTGPQLEAIGVDGPSRHVDDLDGPDLSRLVTGPDVARTVTGPGA